MAEGSNQEVQRAINMLHEAANLISTSMNQGTISVDNTPISSPGTLVENPSVVTNVTQTATTNSTLPTTNSTLPTTTSARGEAVLRNFRSLFAGYGSQEHPPLRSRNQRINQPPAKRSKRQSFFIPKETWTHEFFCLAETDTDRIPNRQEKFILQSAGLGRKKLVFGSKDTAKLVQEKLENAFPKLSHGGGFEILRSDATVKELVIIRPPANVGYAVPFLRNESGLGQALAYIRPVQRNLDISTVALDSKVLYISIYVYVYISTYLHI